MARSFAVVAILASTALAGPLAQPNPNPYAALTVRQEANATTFASSETPTTTLLAEAQAVEGEVTAAEEPSSTTDNYLTTYTPSSCSISIGGGTLVYTKYGKFDKIVR